MLHGLGERVVAAGVENDQPQLPRRLDDIQEAIERDRFVKGIDVALQHGIDRNEIVDALDLDAVAGEIDDGEIGTARVIGKIAQRAAHLDGLEVELEIDGFETGAPEHFRHGGRVVGGVGERRHRLIGGVADHERDSPVGEGGFAEQPHRAECQDDGRDDAHHDFRTIRKL